MYKVLHSFQENCKHAIKPSLNEVKLDKYFQILTTKTIIMKSVYEFMFNILINLIWFSG